MNNPVEKISRGVYRFPSSDSETTVSPVSQPTPAALAEKKLRFLPTAANLMMVTDVENMVPEKFSGLYLGVTSGISRISSSQRYSTQSLLLVFLVMVRL